MVCRSLLIEGKLRGDVRCSGTATINYSGKIPGRLAANHVVIERKSEVHFFRRVRVKSIEIRGHMTGEVIAETVVVIHRGASLDGNVTAKAISVEKGGIFSGQLIIGSSGLTQAELLPATKEASLRPGRRTFLLRESPYRFPRPRPSGLNAQKLLPRSPYERLGGYVHLPRLIDKAKLHRKGLLNGYNYKTVGFDKHLLAFLKLNPDAFEEAAHQSGRRRCHPKMDRAKRREAFCRGDRAMEPGDDLPASGQRGEKSALSTFPEGGRRRRSKRYPNLFRPDRIRRRPQVVEAPG